MKYTANAIKFGNQCKPSSLIVSMILDLNVDLRCWREIKNLGRFGLKIAMCSIFMNKSNMLIINILTGIDDFDSKLQICEIWSLKNNALQF